MRFQPVKCNIMQITRKRIKKINASYSLEGTVLENVEKNQISWCNHYKRFEMEHTSAIFAQRLTGLLRRNLAACPRDVKESAC